MKLTYTKQGDYLIPYITIRQPRKALGHYGRLRKAYLQNFRPILFNELVLSDMLFEHCLEIEETARNQIDVIMSGLMKQYGIRDEQNRQKELPTNKANGNQKSLGHFKGAKAIAR